MLTEYKPLYPWKETWPGETDHEGKPLRDFIGLDGEITIGRISYESHGPKASEWIWSGQAGRVAKRRLLPHQGYCKTAREASRMVEDYYHRLMRYNGFRGSKDTSEA